MQEIAIPPRCEDGSMDPNGGQAQWCNYMLEASRRINQALDNPGHYAQWMIDAGFTNVHQVMYKWPSNPWPKGKKEKTLGLWAMVNALDGLSGFSMAVFTRILGWQPEELEVFLVGVRESMKDSSNHSYYPVYVTYGQKPV